VNVFTLKLLLLNHNISVPKPNNTAQFTSRMGNLYDSGYEMSWCVAMMIEMVTAKVFSLALNHLSKDILSNWEVIAVNQGETSLAFFTYASMVFHYTDAIIFWTGSVDVQGKKVPIIGLGWAAQQQQEGCGSLEPAVLPGNHHCAMVKHWACFVHCCHCSWYLGGKLCFLQIPYWTL